MTLRAATVRFYVDADLLGLALVLAPLREDVTYPSDPGAVIHKRRRPSCPITQVRTIDEEWLPVAAEHGWLVITRDAHIQSRPGEIAAVREHGVKMVNLTADSAGDKWGQLEVVMRNWRAIDELQRKPGPYIYRATLSRLTQIDLSGR